MGCPVPKVRRPAPASGCCASRTSPSRSPRAASRAPAALPVTVKLRSGLRAGDELRLPAALRLVDEAGVPAIAFHPRAANVHHKGTPDYALAARLVERLERP